MKNSVNILKTIKRIVEERDFSAKIYLYRSRAKENSKKRL